MLPALRELVHAARQPLGPRYRAICLFYATAFLPGPLTMRMDDRSLRVLPPILRNKHYDTPSAFTPENLFQVFA